MFHHFNKIVLLSLRYLGNVGIAIPSEHSMRKQQTALLKDNIEGQMIPLLFKSSGAKGLDGMETRKVPCVVVRDIKSMIFDYLDRHHM